MAAVHGILLLDKPLGLSSNQALQKVKRLLRADKAGHTGSLDPLATGMLPICLGEATKVAGYLLGSRKAYEADVRLGVTTTTADAEGEITGGSEIPALADDAVAAILASFLGRIMQRPPAYSAIKRGGVPLYRLVRRGVEVVAPEREVDIASIELLSRTSEDWRIRVVCGSGTYIRSLAVDIGEATGCGAHLAGLRRLWVEPFAGATMLTLAEIPAIVAAGAETGPACLLPIDAGLGSLPRVDLDSAETTRVRHGNPVQRLAEAWEGLCRVYDDAGRLAALGERESGGAVRLKRVFLTE